MKPKLTIKERVNEILKEPENARRTATECKEAFVVKSERQKILEEAIGLICKEREESYGTPQDNFATVANLFDTYLRARYENYTKGDGLLVGPCVMPHDVAVLNILQKVARLVQSPDERDHWKDIAGYAALGSEVRPV